MLPSKVLKEIDSYLKVFLEDGVNIGNKKAKIAWIKFVCKKKEDLELMRSKDWNRVTMMTLFG